MFDAFFTKLPRGGLLGNSDVAGRHRADATVGVVDYEEPASVVLSSQHVRSLPGHRYGFPVGPGAREGPVDERKRYVARSKDLLDFELKPRLESKEAAEGFAECFGTRDGLSRLHHEGCFGFVERQDGF